MTDPRHQFLWLDLETTGLDPHAPHALLLEWAFALCEDDRTISREGSELAIVRAESGVIAYPEDVLERAYEAADPYVQEMHEANDLWTDCLGVDYRGRRESLADADAYLVSVATSLGANTRRNDPKAKLVLAGASVHFDLSWVRAKMPEFAAHLSHRVFDVSTIKIAERAWGDAANAPEFRGVAAHRALDDIKATIEDARRVRISRYGKGAL